MTKFAGSKHGPRAGDVPDLDLEDEEGKAGERRNRRYRRKRPRRRRTYWQKP
jgi:hypothetical protein